MKKHIFKFSAVVLTAAMMASVTSCKDKNEEPAPVLTVSPPTSMVTFDENGSTSDNTTFSVETNQSSWTIEKDQGWVSATKNDAGTGFTISASRNDNQESQPDATVTIKAGKAPSVMITAKQSGHVIVIEPTISIDPDAATVEPEGEDVTIAVTASGEWIVQIPTETAGWVLLKSQSETQAVLTVAENESTNERLATVIFKLTDSNTQTPFNLTQNGIEPFISIDSDVATVEPEGEDVTIAVTASGEWTVQIPTEADWVSLKSQTETQAIFTVAANSSTDERSAVISFKLTDSNTQTPFNLTQKVVYP